MTQLEQDDGADTALARLLHEQQAVEFQSLRLYLDEVRSRRAAEPGLTLASYLLQRELAKPELVEEALRLLQQDPSPQIRTLPESKGRPPSPGGIEPARGSLPREGAQARTELGPYRILRELARGGMGVVYVAFDPRLEREVALKVLHAGAYATVEDLERFQIEARAAGRLRHPNVVQVHEVGQAEGIWYLAMDLIGGASLQATLKERGPFPCREAARIIELVARAIHSAHLLAILHRDLKPQNVLLDEDQVPYVTDFGLAKEIEREEGPTVTGDVLGTPAYMSPEQAQGETARIDGRADVYGLGATLYALLTGRPPFEGASALHVLDQVVHESPAPPSKFSSGLDKDLETICLKCLEKEPAARYQTARELADDLARYQRQEPILARPPGLAERVAKWTRRNRSLTRGVGATLALSLTLLLGATAVFVHRLQAETRQAEEATRREAASAEQAARSAREARAQAKIAREALQDMLYGIQDGLRDHAGRQVMAFREKMLREAVARLLEIQSLEESSNPRLGELGLAYRQIATLSLDAGRVDSAKEALGRLQVLTKAALAAKPDDPDTRWCSLLCELLEGRLLYVERRLPDAVTKLEGVVTKLRAEVEGHPSDFRLRALLADALLRLGGLLWSTEEAEEAALLRCTEALGHYTALPSESVEERLLRNFEDAERIVDVILRRQGNFRQAEATARSSQKWLKSLLLEQPKSPGRRHALAVVTLLLGDVCLHDGDPNSAAQAYEKARRVIQEIAKADPTRVGLRIPLAKAIGRLGMVRELQGDLAQAELDLEEACRLSRQVHADVQRNETLRELANALERLNDLKLKRGRAAEAYRGHLKILAIRERLVFEAKSGLLEIRREYCVSLERVGTLQGADDPLHAIETHLKALKLRRQLMARFPGQADLRADTALSLSKLGALHLRLGDLPAAEARSREALTLLRPALERDPAQREARQEWFAALAHLGKVQIAGHQVAAAYRSQQEALQGRRQLLLEKSTRRARHDLSVSLVEVGAVAKESGDLSAGLALYREARENHQALVDSFPRYRGELEQIERSLLITARQVRVSAGELPP
ncbi:MAG: serine/threonine protein kinase, partial [Planctomycetes bacterium]|nr:serine/threonine protein kinase [Planctomycetota bacterium]